MLAPIDARCVCVLSVDADYKPKTGSLSLSYAYDVPFPNRFSASIQILRTGQGLCERGNRFTMYCGPIRQRSTEIAGDLGIDGALKPTLRQVFPSWPRAAAARALVLRRLTARALRRDRFDALVTRGETGIALGSMTPTPGTARIFEVHKLCFLEREDRRLGARADMAAAIASGGLLFRAEERALKNADGLIFLTDEVHRAAEMAFGFVSVPTIVAPSGVAIPPPPLADQMKDVDCVYAGKLERRKGLFLMLETLARMPGRTLRILGEGPDRKAAEDWVFRHGLNGRVVFEGAVPHADVTRELRRARVGLCLLPQDVDHVSNAFTSPMKLLEMMAAGVPVVATDLPSVRSVCSHDREAVLAPPFPAALAASVEGLLADPDKARTLADAARARARDFSWERRAEKVEALARQCVDKARHRSGTASAGSDRHIGQAAP